MKLLPALLTVFILMNLGAFAQNMDNEDVGQNYLSSQTTPVFKGYKNTKGSIYLDEEFNRGSILIDGKIVASNVGLRYNVHDEQIELQEKTNSSSTVANVVRKDRNVSILIGNTTFVYLPSPDKDKRNGYFILLEEGSTYVLYKKITKDFIEGKESANSYSRDVPDTFKERESLFISTSNGGLVQVPNSKSKRTKLFSPNTDKIKKYIKTEKLNIKKDDDFAKLVTFANSLN